MAMLLFRPIWIWGGT